MKTAALLLTGFTLCALALGQVTPPRQGIALARSSTPTPAPTATPTPLPPSPNGIYSGLVEGNYNGIPSDLGQWVFSILAQRCVDCDPGQYDIDTSTYTGIRYGDGKREQGQILGFINPSGNIVAFVLIPTCSLLTPGPIPEGAGLYFSGGFGEVPGPTLRLSKRDTGFGLPVQMVISGRISGRDCANKLVVTDVTLTKQ